MSPDDYTSDPNPDVSGVPGTVDDVPDTYGQDLSALEEVAVKTPPGPAPSDSDASKEDDERELWGHQKALIEEDEQEGLKLEGFPAEEVPDILEAMGDDAAEPLVDSPNGTSATGAWSEPEHGGFPERKD